MQKRNIYFVKDFFPNLFLIYDLGINPDQGKDNALSFFFF